MVVSLMKFEGSLNAQTGLNRPDLEYFTLSNTRVFYPVCLTPDDFTRQWGNPGSQWVNQELQKVFSFLIFF